MVWLSAAAAFVVVADFVTKFVLTRMLSLVPAGFEVTLAMFCWPSRTETAILAGARGGNIPVIPGFFDLFLQHNTGGAFSLLDQSPLLLLAVSLAALAWIVWWSLQVPRESVSAHVAFGLIIGGALGNLADRLRFGFVVDFLHFHHGEWYWPTFNVADIAICTGIGLLLCLSAFTNKLEKPAPADPDAPTGATDEPQSAAAQQGEDRT